MSQDGRTPLDLLSGRGAKVGDTLVWDGMRWVPGSAVGLAIVDDDEPVLPPTGLLWWDQDATC